MNDNFSSQQCCVIGAGSWGTALACALARNGHQVTLIGRNQDLMQAMRTQRENTVYLPAISLAATIQPSCDYQSALQLADNIILAIPSMAFEATIQTLAPHISAQHKLCIATKGMNTRGLFLPEVLRHYSPAASPAVLSGPSFAHEVARNLPTAVNIACLDAANGGFFCQLFQQPTFRVYPSKDMIGTCLSGTIKNVLAIAAGIADGLQLGANAQAALITRGLHELIRLGRQVGGEEATFMGLAGVGDLLLTCSDNLSRNRRFGLAIGQGQTVDNAMLNVQQVVEGRDNCAHILALAATKHVELPICQEVGNIIAGNKRAEVALHDLLSRPVDGF